MRDWREERARLALRAVYSVTRGWHDQAIVLNFRIANLLVDAACKLSLADREEFADFLDILQKLKYTLISIVENAQSIMNRTKSREELEAMEKLATYTLTQLHKIWQLETAIYRRCQP